MKSNTPTLAIYDSKSDTWKCVPPYDVYADEHQLRSQNFVHCVEPPKAHIASDNILANAPYLPISNECLIIRNGLYYDAFCGYSTKGESTMVEGINEVHTTVSTMFAYGFPILFVVLVGVAIWREYVKYMLR